MKIAILINSMSCGGGEKVASLLLKEYSKSFDVTLICLWNDTFYDIPKNIQIINLNESPPKGGLLKFMKLFIMAFSLKKNLKKKNINFVQSHLFQANFVNVIATILGSKHKCQLVNCGPVSWYSRKGISNRINEILIRTLYKKADSIICKSEGMSNCLRKYVFPIPPVKVINNPYDIQKIISMSNEPVSANDFVFNSQVNYLVNVARFHPQKHHSDLIQALKILNKKNDNYELILLGNGECQEDIKRLAEQSGLKEKVHFLGRVNNPFQYIKNSFLFISSSGAEGFPNVIVESMISGTPVVSTDCESGPREIIAPSTNIEEKLTDTIEISNLGILVPVNRADLLAKAIEYYESNPNYYQGIQKSAEQSSKKYSLSTISNEYRNEIKKIASPSNPHSI